MGVGGDADVTAADVAASAVIPGYTGYAGLHARVLVTRLWS